MDQSSVAKQQGVAQKVHQLDITPTILDLLNLDVPEYMQGKIIELQ